MDRPRRRVLQRCAAVFIPPSLPLLGGCAAGARAPDGPVAEPLSLPKQAYEGETAALRSRLSGRLRCRDGRVRENRLLTLDLSTGELHFQTGLVPQLPWSRNDETGRILRASEGRSRLELHGRDGSKTILFTAPPSASEHFFGGFLAVSPDGARVAWVGSDAPRRNWRVGRLLCLDIDAALAAAAGASPVQDWGDECVPASVVWLSDHRRVAVTVRGPRGRVPGAEPDGYGRAYLDPQIEVVDVLSGTRRALGPGRKAWAPRGAGPLLVRRHALDAEHPQPAAGHDIWARYPARNLWLVDPQSSDTRPLPRVPPEITDVIAWLDQRYLVYRGRVSPGAPSGLTTGNSPLVGPKILEAVKVMDVATGEFLTVLEGVDPRTAFWVV